MAAIRRFQILLDSEQHDTLRRLAFERRTSVSALVREAVGQWVKKQKKGRKGGN